MGVMPQLDYYVTDFDDAEYLTEVELQEVRVRSNDMVFKKFKVTEMDNKILEMKKAEADKGWTEQPRVLTNEDVHNYNPTRTIGVMEWRDHLQVERLRMVDHSTESEINDATGAEGQKMQSDTLETLVWLIPF